MPAVFALTMTERRVLAQGLDALAAIGGATDDVVALRADLRDRIADRLPIPEVPRLRTLTDDDIDLLARLLDDARSDGRGDAALITSYEDLVNRLTFGAE